MAFDSITEQRELATVPAPPVTGERATDPDLHAQLRDELPQQIAVGRGSALFIQGFCFHARERLRDLELSIEGETHPLLAHSMPRSDVYWRMQGGIDAEGFSYWSGFWGMLPLNGIEEPRQVEVGLVATLGRGRRSWAQLGTVELVPGDALGAVPGEAVTSVDSGPWNGSGEPLIAIAMATFDPPANLLARQIASIRAQTHRNWVCVISDDMSRPQHYADLEKMVADDPRFVLVRNNRNLGFYGNFERALSLVPRSARFVTFADQDDRWQPHKLERLLGEFREDTTLVYSDMRIVEPGGELISPTYWSARPTNHTDLGGLLLSNTITGAASLFRRDLLDWALPFPPRLGEPYHDHWVACVALARGTVRYVKEPLYDYVQHRGNVLGHQLANRPGGEVGPRRWRQRMVALRPHHWRERLRQVLAWWRTIYYADLCRIVQAAQVLHLRCGDALDKRRARQVGRVLAMSGAPRGAVWLWWRRLRWLGRKSPTLKQEPRLAKAMLWRWIFAFQTRLRRKPRLAGVTAGKPAQAVMVDEIYTKTAPLNLRISELAPRRVNLLIPAIDLEHFFGGYIAKLNLALGLARRGELVRVISVDRRQAEEPATPDRLSGYEGLADLPARVEFEDASERLRPLEVSPSDSFIASTWWTAHIAHRASRELGRERFLYLIQEYEPFTFPMGSLAALAALSYELPHAPLFSSDLLRDYFEHHRIGIFRDSRHADVPALTFQNALTAVRPPPPKEMASGPRRLIFYARPERHAARNLYELGHLALAGLIESGSLGADWELFGVGAQQAYDVPVARGRSLRVLPRQGQAAYAGLLRSGTVGLSLMYTPHPSLVPLEMAAAGMLVVTNTFENKTAEALAEISPNLIAVEPTVEAVTAGLTEALRREPEHQRRIEGAAVNWSRSWEESFDDRLMAEVAQRLR